MGCTYVAVMPGFKAYTGKVYLVLGIAEDKSVFLTLFTKPLASLVAFNVCNSAAAVYVKINTETRMMLALSRLCNVFCRIVCAVVLFILSIERFLCLSTSVCAVYLEIFKSRLIVLIHGESVENVQKCF